MSQKDSHRKCLSLMNFYGWVDIIWTNTVWILNIKPNFDLNSGWEVAYLLSLLVHAQTVDGLQMNVL